MKCQQKPVCNELAAYRFTWPGREELHVCVAHAAQIKRIADAISMPLQIIAIEIDLKELSDSQLTEIRATLKILAFGITYRQKSKRTAEEQHILTSFEKVTKESLRRNHEPK